MALTTDGWTSRACQSYITITAHFINQNWNLRNFVLQTRLLEQSHTGVNIGAVLREALAEWNLNFPYPVPLVTDNASNMSRAAETAGLTPHIGCFAHTLNLAAQKGMKVPSAARLLGRVRRIVGFFHRSTTANAVLKSKQDLLKLPKLKLIQDVATRWNSSYEMLERYLQQQPAVTAALMSPEIRKNFKDIATLNEDDVSHAEEIVNIMKPLKTMTTVLCTEKEPTISLIFPMQSQIVQTFKESVTDSTVAKDIEAVIMKDIGSRYQDHDLKEFLCLASLLDPRFRPYRS